MSGRSEKVVICGLEKEEGYLYFVDGDGDISRASMVAYGLKGSNKPRRVNMAKKKVSKRSKRQDQKWLALDELKYAPKPRAAGEFLVFAVTIALEIFEVTVKFLLGGKFWTRLKNTAKRDKQHPFSYAANLVDKAGGKK